MEIGKDECVDIEEAKLIMLERGIHMKKDYIGEKFKEYKFWGDFSLPDRKVNEV
jgi:hypothetical protein